MTDDELITGVADDGRLVVTHRLLEGVTLTHRLELEEVVCEWLHVHPDLTPLVAFADSFPLADGTGEVRRLTGTDLADTGLSPDEVVLAGPPGWLGSATMGDVLAVRWADGALELAPAELDGAAETSAAVDALLLSARTSDPAPSVVELALRLLAADRERFDQAGAPIGDLLAGANLVVVGDEVVDAESRAAQAPTGRTRVSIPGVTTDGVSALQRLWVAVAGFAETGEVTAAPDLEGALANAEAAGALGEQLFGGEAVAPDLAQRFVTAVAAAVPRPAGTALLVGRSAEADNRTDDAESAVRDTLRRDPRFTPGLLDAAWFASDRGEAGRALALLMAARVERNDPELMLLRQYTVPGPDHVGRNAPCPCGSGRKYKHCHLRTYGHQLPVRTPWLYAKASAFAQRPPQRRGLFALARAYAQVPEGSDDTARLLSAACEPILLDLHLFDGGTLAGFLEARGGLLPDDERRLAESWVGTGVRLWERGPDATLTDAVDGTTVSLVPSPELPPRFLAAAVPAADGERRWLAGQPLPVPHPVAADLAEVVSERGGAEALARFLGERLGWTSPPDE